MSVDSGSEDGEYEDSDQSDDDRGMSVSSDNRSRHASEENKQQPAMLPKIMEWAQIFALLLASYLSIDLIGFGFLLLFLAWIRKRPSADQRKWISFSIRYACLAYSALTLIFQTVVITALAIKFKDESSQSSMWIFKLFGLSIHISAKSIIQVLLPSVLVLVNSIVIVCLSWNDHADAEEEEISKQGDLKSGPSGSTLSILLDIFPLPTAILYPSFAGLPYLLLFLGRVYMWAKQRSHPIANGWKLSILSKYTGLHIIVTYLWQIEVLRATQLVSIARWAGIIDLHSGPGISNLMLKVAMLTFLHILYMISCRISREHKSEDQDHHLAIEAWNPFIFHQGHVDTNSEMQQPLLTGEGRVSSQEAPSFLDLTVLVVVSILQQSLENICQIPAFIACVLLAHSLLQPSIISALILAMGTWLLLQPSKFRRRMLDLVQPILLYSYFLWLVCTYCTQSVAQKLDLPDLIPIIGIKSSGDPTMACLILFAQAVICILLRAVRRQRQNGESLSREGSLNANSGTEAEIQGQGTENSLSILGTVPAKFLWYLGFIGIPIALFFIGTLQYDALHAVYVVLILNYIFWPSFSFTPSPLNAYLDPHQHWLVRITGSIHILAIYVLYILKLPAFSHFLHFESARNVLEILGLWHLTRAKSMLPLIGLLILVTFHAGLGKWLLDQRKRGHENSRESGIGSEGHPVYVMSLARLCVSIGPLLLVALGYCLVLFDCKIGLLGLGYLVIVACVLIWPAQKCRYEELDENGKAKVWQESCMPQLLQNHKINLKNVELNVLGSRSKRWMLLALMCTYALLDFLVQYSLPSKFIQSILHVTDSQLRFIESVVGFDTHLYRWKTVVFIMRPLAILGSLRLLHFGFALGTLQAQEEEAWARDSIESEDSATHNEKGLLALIRRILILNSSKFVALCIFAIVVQHPSAVSLLVLVGLLGASRIFGGPTSWKPSRRNSMQMLLVILVIGVVAWMVSLYAFQVKWVRQKLGSEDRPVLRLLEWIGVATKYPNKPLEPILRFKCLLLVSIAIKQRAIRWHKYLPDRLKDQCSRGRQCSLFWPSPTEHESSPEFHGGKWLAWWADTSVIRYFSLLVKGISIKARFSTQKILEAVEWHSTESQAETKISEQDGALVRFSQNLSRKVAKACRAVILTAQIFIDNIWERVGFDISLALLLVTAFIDTNILSLAFMFFLFLGMSLSNKARKVTWRLLVVPCLALLLLWQYVVLLGWHPLRQHNQSLGRHHHGKHHHHHYTRKEALLDWLGMGLIDSPGIWALFLTFAGATLQVHKDLWADYPRDLDTGSELPNEIDQQMEDGCLIQGNAARLDNFRPGDQDTLSAQNWLEFWFFKHSMDIVLILVVALCTVETDIIHAIYLALALLLFRRRDDVQAAGNRIFVWLVIYNFAVNLAKIVYQAPLTLLFKGSWDFTADLACSFPHLLGLYKFLRIASDVKGLTAHGTLADIALWLIFRMESHILASKKYESVMRVVRRRQTKSALQAKNKVQEEVRKQGNAALEHFRLRRERAQRIDRLKEGICRTTGGMAIGSALINLHEVGNDLAEEDNLLQQAIPGVRPLDADSQLPVSSMSSVLPFDDTKQEKQNEEQETEEQNDAQGVSSWLKWLLGLVLSLRRRDKQSYICCVAFVVFFLIDCSILALILQLGLFTYALVTSTPSIFYWQATLVYTEAILVAQYVFQLPVRLHCGFLSPKMRDNIELLGLHSSRLRVIPIFCVYLITLMHNYNVWRQQDPNSRRKWGLLLRKSFDIMRTRSTISARSSPLSQFQRVHKENKSIFTTLKRIFAAMREFMLRACTQSERPMHFINVTLTNTSDDAQVSLDQLDTQVLEASLQTMLNVMRNSDIEQNKCSNIGNSEHNDDQPEVSEIASVSEEKEIFQETKKDDDRVENDFETEHLATGKYSSHSLQGFSSVDLSHIGPLRLKLVETSHGHEEGEIGVLMNVRALSPDPDLPASQRTPYKWAMRSLTPAKDAAQALLRKDATELGIPLTRRPDRGNSDSENPDSSEDISGKCHDEKEEDENQQDALSVIVPGPLLDTSSKTWEESETCQLRVKSVEWHSQTEQDWYAVTIAIDMLVFIYTIIFYQAVVASASSLQDINNDKSVPVDFLTVLLIMFGLMVLDRVFYTLGNHFGKALLLVSQMGLFYGHCLRLFWSGTINSSAKQHIRVILLLKSLSFAFSALQLRSGYPSPASYRSGQGRHSMVFFRQVNMLGSIAYNIFAAVPFLYELRALLDWSCTATTLTLFDWLKLEDINTSLFLVTVNRKLRERRRLGQRQPRYLKFFQGTLLFTGLLILLWAPLIAFSSGNGLYSVPKVVSYGVNVSLGVETPSTTISYPIFKSGGKRSQENWVAEASDLPQTPTQTYTVDQAKLLCLAKESDEIWLASPPAQNSLKHILNSENVTLSMGWEIRRDSPIQGQKSGPDCAGIQNIVLASDTTRALKRLIEGKEDSVQLANAYFLNGTHTSETSGSLSLYGYVWQVRGSDCLINTNFAQRPGWLNLGVACNASLPTKSGQKWWSLKCGLIHANGSSISESGQSLQGHAECNSHYNGPRVVTVLERVQTGIIGETLSSFGIIGLYITVVLAIGRFLRFSTKNMRMRIQYEDLPNTRRLVTICQDIYIARAEEELVLEEELYWGLVNIFRLPSMLFEMTKKTKTE